VALPGHVNPVSDALLAADALVMSSDYEGVPAVVPEALAAGLPVVSTDCSVSMADLLGHGRFGLLVPVRDEAALAGAMDRITALPLIRRRPAPRRAASPWKLPPRAISLKCSDWFMADHPLPGTGGPVAPAISQKADGAAASFAVTPRPGLNETQ
jgi:hypothetical protein